MHQLKYLWDQNYPDETYVSRQNLRDNTERTKEGIGLNGDSVIEAAKRKCRTEKETRKHNGQGE